MKKLLLPFFVIGTFTAYALHQRGEDTQAVLAVQKTQPTPTLAIKNTPAPTSSGASPIPTAIVKNTPTPNLGQYKNGTYTGDPADAFYGNVQIAIVVNNGKISDVQFLQYPNDRQNSVEISRMSLPLLKQEAIKAQSANVDIVSGATQTSEAFKQSLQTALEKAKV